MNERSYPLHPRLALLLLTLLAGFVGFLSLVPLTQGAPILGAAIALGAAAVLIVSILLQRDRVIVAPDRIEVEGTFRAQVFPFAKLGPGALSIARLSIVLTTSDRNTGKPFEVPPGARLLPHPGGAPHRPRPGREQPRHGPPRVAPGANARGPVRRQRQRR